MSYVVLARRWRPQQFSDIIGQEHVSTTLTNAISNDRIAHSFIFSGPRGVGKTTTARILAKALNCETGPTATPCNECSSCQSITTGNSMDVLEIDGASNRGIDEIRNLRENIRFSPSQGKYRIYIIDEVHMLTKEAFNALLKTLEEPPEHAVFIFATTEIHRVPATILSRCQRFDFKRMPVETIIGHLQHICKEDGINIQKDALLEIAKKADGSMRDAQSILDQIISFSGTDVSTDHVARALGIIDQEYFFKFSTGVREGNTKELLLLSRQLINDGVEIGEFLSGFEEHMRNLLVTLTVQSTEMINVSENWQQRFLDESKLFREEDLLHYIQQINDMQTALKWSSHPQMKFELGLLKMARMPSAVRIEELLEKIDLIKKKNKINTPAAGKVAPQSPPKMQKAPLSYELICNKWPSVIQSIQSEKALLADAVSASKPYALEDSTLDVRFTKAHTFQYNMVLKNKRFIENQLANIVGHTLILECKIDESLVEEKTVQTNTAKKDPNAIEKLKQSDPVLNKLIDELGLELI